MAAKKEDIFDSTMEEIRLQVKSDDKASLAYCVLSDKEKRTSLKHEQKVKLFKVISEATGTLDFGTNFGAYYFLGDCYWRGYGCKRSKADAIACNMKILDSNDKNAEEWKEKAANSLGNIYLAEKKYDEAREYIYRSNNPKGFNKIADVLWDEGEQSAALEDYKSAGKLGRIKSYAKAAKKCLESSDNSISERAEEFAILFFKTDADKKYKQALADKIVLNYYSKLADAPVTKKEEMDNEFTRFKKVLKDNNLIIKEESKIRKFIRDNGSSIAATGIISAVSAVGTLAYNVVKKAIKI